MSKDKIKKVERMIEHNAQKEQNMNNDDVTSVVDKNHYQALTSEQKLRARRERWNEKRRQLRAARRRAPVPPTVY